MIEVEDFHKAYDSAVAVSGLSFRVGAGEVLGLIGPNGAGKTTTLRAIAGIIPASRGQLVVSGHDLRTEPLEAKRKLAYVPDDPPQFADLTVAQHLAFTASVYGVAEAEQKGTELLDAFELRSRADTPARDLSRGMRQKLAICCAYLYDPAVLLLDEPLTGLDPHGIRTLKQTIIDRAGSGSAVVVSSHLLAMVEDVCTHVLILHRGRARFAGSVKELYQHFQAGGEQASLEEIFFAATSQV